MSETIDLHLAIDRDFSGALSVTGSGRSLLRQAFGEADRTSRTPNQLTTRFQTASAGKGFVAVGIMRLIADGRLTLDDRIGDVLDLDWQAICPEVTIRQLLTHTSGVPDYFDERTMTDYAALWQDRPNYRMRQQADLIPLFIDQPMQYPPGGQFRYNNTGFVLLGLVIEALSGQVFDTYLHDHVFVPAGMERTGYYELDSLPEGCAQAYRYDPERQCFVSNIYSIEAKGSGAGGAFTTLEDMERFWRALFSGRLLPLPLVSEMIRPQTGEAKELYGLGFWLEPSGENRWTPRLDGSDPGVSFVSSHDPDSHLTITVISNLEQDVWTLRQEIQKSLSESSAASDRSPSDQPAKDPAEFELTTERLLIRRFRPSDAEALYAYLSDEEVVHFEPYEVVSWEEAVEEASRRASDSSFYAVCLRDSGQLIGNLYLGQEEFEAWEIGYVFNRSYQGKGYATESASRLLRYAFEQLGARRVTAGCALQNPASWRLLERLGLRREGVQRQRLWFKRDRDGRPEWLDSCLYAMLRPEWERLTAHQDQPV